MLYHLRERTDMRHSLPTSTPPLQHHFAIPVLLKRILHNSSGDLRVGAPCGLSAVVPRGLSRAYLRLHRLCSESDSRDVDIVTWSFQQPPVLGARLVTDDLAI